MEFSLIALKITKFNAYKKTKADCKKIKNKIK